MPSLSTTAHSGFWHQWMREKKVANQSEVQGCHRRNRDNAGLWWISGGASDCSRLPFGDITMLVMCPVALAVTHNRICAGYLEISLKIFLKKKGSYFSDAATQLLIQGNNRITAALQIAEKAGDFLESVPIQRLLDMYERLKSREKSLKAIKGPISTTNARIYLDEAKFADMVKEMIILSLEVEDEGETSAADVKTA
ncbi:hypothetical protein B0H10DRAFT_1942589 [Mycena sp. CBHHK59/15]|nr:hypothetical protein B0H10DRAFT_1942589 [Mycena sp. CBHHK59/15]